MRARRRAFGIPVPAARFSECVPDTATLGNAAPCEPGPGGLPGDSNVSATTPISFVVEFLCLKSPL